MNESESEMNAFCVYWKQNVLSFTNRLIVYLRGDAHTDRAGRYCACGAVYEAGSGALCSCRSFYVAVCPVYVFLPLLSSPLCSALMAARL